MKSKILSFYLFIDLIPRYTIGKSCRSDHVLQFFVMVIIILSSDNMSLGIAQSWPRVHTVYFNRIFILGLPFEFLCRSIINPN